MPISARSRPVRARPKVGRVDGEQLEATVQACRELIDARFPEPGHAGAAAMLLADGTILTGTSPTAINPSVEVCHEIEPYAAAYRLNRPILASICLHRHEDGRMLVLSPCGGCRERLAVHGPGLVVAVADHDDASRIVWKELREVLPDYWMTVFPERTLQRVAMRRPPVPRRLPLPVVPRCARSSTAAGLATRWMFKCPTCQRALGAQKNGNGERLLVCPKCFSGLRVDPGPEVVVNAGTMKQSVAVDCHRSGSRPRTQCPECGSRVNLQFRYDAGFFGFCAKDMLVLTVTDEVWADIATDTHSSEVSSST